MEPTKKEVYNYWLNKLTGLTHYRNGKFYTILEPFIMGIELIKLPRVPEYRPHFCIYPLYRNTIEECLKYSVLYFEIRQQKGKRRGLQYDIPYNVPLSDIDSVVEDLYIQLGFNFSGDITIDALDFIIDEQANSDMTKQRLKQPDIYKMKYMMHLYISDKHAKNVIKTIEKESKNWDLIRFKAYYGSFNSWLEKLKSVDRDNHVNLIRKMSDHPQIKKLI